MRQWLRDRRDLPGWYLGKWAQWWRDSWYIITTKEGCQKPVGDGYCRRRHRHRGWHKPYK